MRVWNPSRELRPGQTEDVERSSIWGVDHDLREGGPATGDVLAGAVTNPSDAAEAARSQHVDARRHAAVQSTTREVWDNPVLWREICTWAYGRKVLIIRVGYLILFAMAWLGLSWYLPAEAALEQRDVASVIPGAAQALAPFLLASLVLINALAVNSITNERDGQASTCCLSRTCPPPNSSWANSAAWSGSPRR